MITKIERVDAAGMVRVFRTVELVQPDQSVLTQTHEGICSEGHPRVQAWLAAGGLIDPAPNTPYQATVRSWQLRKALRQLGHRDAVVTALTTAPEEIQDAWQSEPTFDRRQCPFTKWLRDTVGLTSNQLNTLFQTAELL